MSYRIHTLVALAATGLAAGSLAAQQRSVAGSMAATGTPLAAGSAAAAPVEAPAPVVADQGRRAKLARMYELQRGNRDLRQEVSETAKVEHDLELELGRLRGEAREGEREIAALDSAIASTRAERLRLEERLRALQALQIERSDSGRVVSRRQLTPVPAPAPVGADAADSARAMLAPPAATVDSVVVGDERDAPGPRPLAISPRRRSRARQWAFYGGVAAGVVAVRAFHLDSDPGGYRDGFKTESTFPDKAVHVLAAWAITNLGTDLKVGAWKSAAAVCAGGVGFEFAQGYVSPYDIGANCIGAAGAAAWRTWVSR